MSPLPSLSLSNHAPPACEVKKRLFSETRLYKNRDNIGDLRIDTILNSRDYFRDLRIDTIL